MPSEHLAVGVAVLAVHQATGLHTSRAEGDEVGGVLRMFVFEEQSMDRWDLRGPRRLMPQGGVGMLLSSILGSRSAVDDTTNRFIPDATHPIQSVGSLSALRADPYHRTAEARELCTLTDTRCSRYHGRRKGEGVYLG